MIFWSPIQTYRNSSKELCSSLQWGDPSFCKEAGPEVPFIAYKQVSIVFNFGLHSIWVEDYRKEKHFPSFFPDVLYPTLLKYCTTLKESEAIALRGIISAYVYLTPNLHNLSKITWRKQLGQK